MTLVRVDRLGDCITSHSEKDPLEAKGMVLGRLSRVGPYIPGRRGPLGPR